MDCKKYKLHHLYWYQTQLKKGENDRVINICRKYNVTWSESDLGVSAIEKLYPTDALKEIFQIILKLEKRNIFKRLWNKIAIELYRIDVKNIIDELTKGEIGNVLADFFRYRSTWITDLLNMQEKSVLTYQKLIQKMAKKPDSIVMN